MNKSNLIGKMTVNIAALITNKYYQSTRAILHAHKQTNITRQQASQKKYVLHILNIINVWK